MLEKNAHIGTDEWIAVSKNLKISPLSIGNANSEPVFVTARENPLHREDSGRLVTAAAKNRPQAG